MLHHVISTLGIDFHSGCSHIGHISIIWVEVFVYKNFNRTPVSSCCIGDHLQQSNTHGFRSKRFRRRTDSLLSKDLLDKSAYDLSSWYHIVLHHITSYWHFITVYDSILLYITFYHTIWHCIIYIVALFLNYSIYIYYITFFITSNNIGLPQKEYQIHRGVWAHSLCSTFPTGKGIFGRQKRLDELPQFKTYTTYNARHILETTWNNNTWNTHQNTNGHTLTYTCQCRP